jgi:hypothetical protein
LQVFAEGSTFRGHMKTIARPIVLQSYKQYLDPTYDRKKPQSRKKLIVRNVTQLLREGNFLQNGVDANVRYCGS